jgi:aerobic-type carbon monoxide dehydrogenase small subunit (CoxS/CutS family)
MSTPIHLTLNGKPATIETDRSRTLLWVLRGDLGLTGTKFGCGAGICGACTVVVDGRAVRACQTSLGEVAGKSVVTIEGLASNGTLHPLQQAFVDHGGMQCGYCTPGMIMNAYGLLQDKASPSPEEIRRAMEDNLCRCGAHKRILAAIEAVAKAGGGRHA